MRRKRALEICILEAWIEVLVFNEDSRHLKEKKMIEALSKESRYPEVSRHTKSVSDTSGRSPDERGRIMRKRP